MRCISPLHITWDGRNDIVPCGKCNFCLQTKRAQWSFRVNQELKVCNSAYFLTLTYSEDNLPWTDVGPTLVKSDYQLFMKRLRKECPGVKLRYFTAGEYGTELGRPHYHMLLFNLPKGIDVEEVWGKGFVYPGEVEPASIHYVTGYVINKPVYDYAGREPPFAVMSRRPGIGLNYLTPQMKKWHVSDLRNYTQLHGEFQSLSRYYKDKIFSKEQKQEIADVGAWKGIEAYRKQVQEIAKKHSDPERYIAEALKSQHDKIRTSKQKL